MTQLACFSLRRCVFSVFLVKHLTHNFFSQEADRHAKELIEEEEKRKERTERNKRKKLVSFGTIIRFNIILNVGFAFYSDSDL